jgi:hypothetical protein
MKIETTKRWLRIIGLLVLVGSLSGCMYWIRAYQTYLQMNEFDRYFAVVTSDEFTLQFKTHSLQQGFCCFIQALCQPG